MSAGPAHACMVEHVQISSTDTSVFVQMDGKDLGVMKVSDR